MILHFKFWRIISLSNNGDDEWSKKNEEEIKNQHKETLESEKGFRIGDDIILNDEMEESTRKQFESLQNWISNNLIYISTNISYLAVHAKDGLARSMIKVLIERHKKLEKEFEKIKNPKIMKYSDMPFNPSVLLHIRQSVFPLIGEIIPLKKEVEAMSKKFFKLEK